MPVHGPNPRICIFNAVGNPLSGVAGQAARTVECHAPLCGGHGRPEWPCCLHRPDGGYGIPQKHGLSASIQFDFLQALVNEPLQGIHRMAELRHGHHLVGPFEKAFVGLAEIQRGEVNLKFLPFEGRGNVGVEAFLSSFGLLQVFFIAEAIGQGYGEPVSILHHGALLGSDNT